LRSFHGLATLLALTLTLVAPSGTAGAQAAGQRSAQGDCARELGRRGYSDASFGRFEQTRDGWQIDVRARDHKGRFTDGSCFVETRTGDVSLYGFGWGGSAGVDRFEFTCASKDEKYRECQLPVDGRVRLVKRKSDAPCIEGRTWGQRRNRVWVDDGCRARFEVVRGGSGGSGAQQIDCRSKNERYRECDIERGYVGRLVRDYSGRCRKDSTWGSRPGAIWVTSGCEGRFQLVPAGGHDAGSGGAAAAERACLAEAQRLGHRVIGQDSARPIKGGYGMSLTLRWGRGATKSAFCRYKSSNGRVEIDF